MPPYRTRTSAYTLAIALAANQLDVTPTNQQPIQPSLKFAIIFHAHEQVRGVSPPCCGPVHRAPARVRERCLTRTTHRDLQILRDPQD